MFFPSGWCFFYLVTTGWIFDISLLCDNSINQSILHTFCNRFYLVINTGPKYVILHEVNNNTGVSCNDKDSSLSCYVLSSHGDRCT